MLRIETQLKDLEERVKKLEEIVQGILYALSIMTSEPEELSEEEVKDVAEALKDYLEGKRERFITLDELEKQLEK